MAFTYKEAETAENIIKSLLVQLCEAGYEDAALEICSTFPLHVKGEWVDIYEKYPINRPKGDEQNDATPT